MSTYRRMRRQARQARRSGLQPMMVINSGEPFPETVGMVLLRWAWRYRSELAPARRDRRHRGAAWWLHADRPHWWFLVAVHGRRGRLGGGRFRRAVGTAALIERMYAAVAICVAGVWLSAAIALGPFVSPLLQILADRRARSCRCLGGRIDAGARRSASSASSKLGPISPRP